ncbi:MAG: fused MFS/spermidine synthase [Elusimicrobiota bacterium]|nr:fused MFS/spermidine synthase [Elusimicrobiota bacterium]
MSNIAVFLCFLLSGISGLIYEVVWAKYLVLIFGSTTYAHILVLTTFMGGLALGNLLFGRFADKVKDPLKLYAWLEMGIALFCVFTPGLFMLLRDFYLFAAGNYNLNPFTILMIRFVIGVFIMLIPTVLMGGTLPTLSKYMVKSLFMRGETVARLYYVNSCGAVAGTIFAGFYLIYHFGLEFSVSVAAIINFIAGGTIFVLKELVDRGAIKAPGESRESSSVDEACYKKDVGSVYSARIIHIALAGIFLSGVAAMLYEVVWIRLLALILGSYTYSFSLMLAAFISGITIGSFLISRFMPLDRFAFLYFGLCQIFIALALILSIPFYEKLPLLFLAITKIFARTPGTFMFFEAGKFLLCFTVMLLPTVFLGMTLPLVGKITADKLELLGKNIGGVFAFNTAGNILGALITGLMFIPAFGLKQTLEIGILINLTLGSIVILTDRTLTRKYGVIIVSFCCLAFTGYMTFVPQWHKSCLTAQLFRGHGQAVEYLAGNHESEFLFYEDGLEATVAVSKSRNGELSLFVNGKVDASSGVDMLMQILLAQIPLILKPDAKDALVLGLGSGVSCGSALLHPIENLDVVEISNSVVKGSKYFSRFNYNALADKRAHLYVEDAKTFIRRAGRKYDLVLSEPSNPWMAGVAGLFSVEYFKDCSDSLKDDGLMVQWVQAYETDDDTFKIVLNTFHSVFPQVTVWNIGMDTILIGSRKKIIPDFTESERVVKLKPIKDELARIKIHDLFTLLSLQLCSTGNLEILTGMGGTVNSDYYPVLEYRAPISLYAGSTAMQSVLKLDERKFSLSKTELLLSNYLENHKITEGNLRSLFTFIEENKAIPKSLLSSVVQKWIKEYPRDPEALAGYARYNIESLERGRTVLENLIKKNNNFKYLKQYAELQLKKNSTIMSFLNPEVFGETVNGLRMCIGLSKDRKAYFYYLLGKLYFENRDYRDAVNSYAEAEKLIRSEEDAGLQGLDYTVFLEDLGVAYLSAGDLAKGFEYFQKARFRKKQ